MMPGVGVGERGMTLGLGLTIMVSFSPCFTFSYTDHRGSILMVRLTTIIAMKTMKTMKMSLTMTLNTQCKVSQ
jgi:hypothetical protein